MNANTCASRLIARVPLEVRLRFASDPKAEVTDCFGVRARSLEVLTERRDNGGACDGVSFLDDGVLFYAPTPYSKRDNFTLAHEVGHHLVNQDDDVVDWIYDQDDHGAILETVCDGVAQQLLLATDSVATFLHGRKPAARDVIELFENSAASRPVCAIAIAQHLPGMGAVALIDRRTMSISTSSVHAHPEHGWPFIYPWPGQAIPEGHQLRNLVPGAGPVTRKVSWPGRFGRVEDFYVNALATPNGIVAVFADEDLWGTGALPQELDREWDTRPLLTGWCCGAAFQVRGYPCDVCGTPFCPVCKMCAHEKRDAKAKPCTECFVIKPAHLMVDGVCEECRG